LDVINVAWVKAYINSLKNVTAIMVSHDSSFLNDCCTDILQIERLKLKHYRGNLDHFLEINPEARAYFNLRESKLKFKFPQPGPIEGVKSRSKALMKMSHCYFTYDGNTVPTLFDISVQVSMCSRVGCVGENGAGDVSHSTIMSCVIHRWDNQFRAFRCSFTSSVSNIAILPQANPL
jgi:elongation factor 3